MTAADAQKEVKMTQKERRLYLLHELLKEQPAYKKYGNPGG